MSKQQYKQQNIDFLISKRQEPDVSELTKGILYKVIKSGNGEGKITIHNVVCCYYKGSLINGRVFDNTFTQGYPEALRVKDLIVGFQIALEYMHIGDRWIVYIPSDLGYGKRGDDTIPANSTLTFEIEVVSVM